MSKVKDSTKRERRLLQKAALASGAAALMARKSSRRGGPARRQRLFPAGFRNEKIKTSGAEINAVIGGSGPPVLLFHGAPQSLITWRLIALDLAKAYRAGDVRLARLRRFEPMAARRRRSLRLLQTPSMALDGVAAREGHLGYNQFRMVGHDRGGRVGRRMALDHPDKCHEAGRDGYRARALPATATSQLDFVQAYFHWFNDLRPEPIPRKTRSRRLPIINWRALPTKSSLSICGIIPTWRRFTQCVRIIAPRPRSI